MQIHTTFHESMPRHSGEVHVVCECLTCITTFWAALAYRIRSSDQQDALPARTEVIEGERDPRRERPEIR